MKQKPEIFFTGIDYGGKSAGTTVIAYPEDGLIRFAGSAGCRDADRFILNWSAQYAPQRIYIDAPLSLPGVYRYPERYDDYFYRVADRAVSAMSPMFLGGLTARAIQLRDKLRADGIETVEVYPARLAAELGFDRRAYKRSKKFLSGLTDQLCVQIPMEVDRAAVSSWHHFDALLAFLSGWRHQQGRHLFFGEIAEGQILV